MVLLLMLQYVHYDSLATASCVRRARDGGVSLPQWRCARVAVSDVCFATRGTLRSSHSSAPPAMSGSPLPFPVHGVAEEFQQRVVDSLGEVAQLLVRQRSARLI